MARELPTGQHWVIGMKAGSKGRDVAIELLVKKEAKTNTPKAKEKPAIVLTFSKSSAGNTEQRVADLRDFQINLHLTEICPDCIIQSGSGG